MNRRWTEVLCTKCGGNGVVKITGGVSQCPRCDGRCYEPEADSAAAGLLSSPVSQLASQLATARLAVNDWVACSTNEELDRWRQAQQRLIVAAKAVEAASLASQLDALQAEIERLKVEHTRAILHFTVKGYTAGENADAKHWRERAEHAEAEIERLRAEVSSALDATSYCADRG